MNQLASNFFLVCFIVGLILVMVSLLFGGHGGHHGIHIGHHGIDMGHHGGGDGGIHVSFFSYQGILMFLTWFGGVGYALNRDANIALLLVLLGALVAGLVGAGLVFIFLAKFIIPGETEMRPVDYYLPGTLARVCTPIRPGQTGEVVYVQGGSRKTLGARADAEEATHLQGEEVLIVRYDKGIAYVKSIADEFKEG